MLSIVIPYIFTMIVLFFVLKYINNVETKNCNEIINLWEFRYIKYYTRVLIIINTLFIIFYPVSLVFFQKHTYIYLFPLLGSLIFVISIFRFLKKTKNDKCSESWEKKLLRIYGIVYTIFITLSIISLIILNLHYIKNT